MGSLRAFGVAVILLAAVLFAQSSSSQGERRQPLNCKQSLLDEFGSATRSGRESRTRSASLPASDGRPLGHETNAGYTLTVEGSRTVASQLSSLSWQSTQDNKSSPLSSLVTPASSILVDGRRRLAVGTKVHRRKRATSSSLEVTRQRSSDRPWSRQTADSGGERPERDNGVRIAALLHRVDDDSRQLSMRNARTAEGTGDSGDSHWVKLRALGVGGLRQESTDRRQSPTTSRRATLAANLRSDLVEIRPSRGYNREIPKDHQPLVRSRYPPSFALQVKPHPKPATADTYKTSSVQRFPTRFRCRHSRRRPFAPNGFHAYVNNGQEGGSSGSDSSGGGASVDRYNRKGENSQTNVNYNGYHRYDDGKSHNADQKQHRDYNFYDDDGSPTDYAYQNGDNYYGGYDYGDQDESQDYYNDDDYSERGRYDRRGASNRRGPHSSERDRVRRRDKEYSRQHSFDRYNNDEHHSDHDQRGEYNDRREHAWRDDYDWHDNYDRRKNFDRRGYINHKGNGYGKRGASKKLDDHDNGGSHDGRDDYRRRGKNIRHDGYDRQGDPGSLDDDDDYYYNDQSDYDRLAVYNGHRGNTSKRGFYEKRDDYDETPDDFDEHRDYSEHNNRGEPDSYHRRHKTCDRATAVVTRTAARAAGMINSTTATATRRATATTGPAVV